MNIYAWKGTGDVVTATTSPQVITIPDEDHAFVCSVHNLSEDDVLWCKLDTEVGDLDITDALPIAPGNAHTFGLDKHHQAYRMPPIRIHSVAIALDTGAADTQAIIAFS